MAEQEVQHVNYVEVEDTSSTSTSSFTISGEELADNASSSSPNRKNSQPVTQRKVMTKEEMDANGMEASTASSTGSNYAIIMDELADDASSSNPIQCKAQCVGYIFKLSDEIPLDQQLRDQIKRLMIEPTGPGESTAESALPIINERKYTVEMIHDKLQLLGLDPCTLSEACDLLAHNANELELFLGVPPKCRMSWINRRVCKRKDRDSEEQNPIKRSKRDAL